MLEQARRKQPDLQWVLGDLSSVGFDGEFDLDALSRFLSDAGFAIEQQFGDWERQPLTDDSPEIITIAAPA